MKTRLKRILSGVVAGIVMSGVSGAQEDNDPFGSRGQSGRNRFNHFPSESTIPPALIRIQVEHIEVDHKDLPRLMEIAGASLDNTKLRDALLDMVKQEKAKMLDTSVVVCKNGEFARAQSGQCFIYPTENELGKVRGRTSHLPRSVSGPTAFKEKGIETQLGVDAVIGKDPKFISIDLHPKLSYLAGEKVSKVSKEKNAVLGESSVIVPLLYTTYLQTAVEVMNTKPLLAGVVTRKNSDGVANQARKVLVLVQGTILK